MPVLTGVMLSLVSRKLKTKANSLVNFATNGLGYFPAPYLYGVSCELSGEGTRSRWGMTMLMGMTVVGNLFILAGFYFYKDPK